MNFLILIVGGIVIGLIVAAPIGPVNLICIRRTFFYGPLNGFFAGLGAALGDGVFAILTAFGVTAITRWIEGYATILEIAGGLMLIGFGLHIFGADVALLCDSEGVPVKDKAASSLTRTILSTFALTITNPATLIGFTALFAGLGSLAGRQTRFLDAAITVAGVVAGSTIWWFTLTTIVGIFHRHINMGVMRSINRFFGAAVTLFGVVVLGDLATRLA
jgi:threonine/homoserine/homoserine lactone efflux protein